MGAAGVGIGSIGGQGVVSSTAQQLRQDYADEQAAGDHRQRLGGTIHQRVEERVAPPHVAHRGVEVIADRSDGDHGHLQQRYRREPTLGHRSHPVGAERQGRGQRNDELQAGAVPVEVVSAAEPV